MNGEIDWRSACELYSSYSKELDLSLTAGADE